MKIQHSEDFKIAAINYYKLSGDSLQNVSTIFQCSKSSLQRWIKIFEENDTIVRKDYKTRVSKMTDEILEFIKEQIYDDPTIILKKIIELIKIEYGIKFSLSYICDVLRNKLNITLKQVRKKYYPRQNQDVIIKSKLEFYNIIRTIGMDNIISIDESAFYLNMTRNFGRSEANKKCYHTTNFYPYKKYNFICAIKYGKIMGYELYEYLKDGVKTDDFISFINMYVKNKYKNYVIILDNATFHRSNITKAAILQSGNNYLYSLPYSPELNPIENMFSQLKNYVRQESPQIYRELNKTIKL